MVLLRRVIGDALRARRQGQHRTLREVSTAANVSLGYLSEIERGQKEASSELLAAICDALGARLSEVLGEVSDTLALAEDMDGAGTCPFPFARTRRSRPRSARPASGRATSFTRPDLSRDHGRRHRRRPFAFGRRSLEDWGIDPVATLRSPVGHVTPVAQS